MGEVIRLADRRPPPAGNVDRMNLALRRCNAAALCGDWPAAARAYAEFWHAVFHGWPVEPSRPCDSEDP